MIINDKESLNKYGPRLTEQQYIENIKSLYESAARNLKSEVNTDIKEVVNEAEFNLGIDYRLGTYFPFDKRHKLWAIKKRADKKRLTLVYLYLLKCIQTRQFADGMQVYLDYLINEYKNILTEQEICDLFDIKKGEKAVFPIDPHNL